MELIADQTVFLLGSHSLSAYIAVHKEFEVGWWVFLLGVEAVSWVVSQGFVIELHSCHLVV